ncbi:hypothetical protein PR202_gb04597 [Eleusine coracana subsp. coracana]|uniref:Tyrosinase copper-binding domain-containing protein n=1 Tax=Eleusine coracana subsp. coracana TaxID=191504 RepID=A0AAV5E5M2_ELECO|nr:hypothetical protein PR202_gb04597 [Eleusine coracana subsp. coracana]
MMQIPNEFTDWTSLLYDTRWNLRLQHCGRQRFLISSSCKWRTITPTSRRLNATFWDMHKQPHLCHVKYARGVAAMKVLSRLNPHNFYQKATTTVSCCSGVLRQPRHLELPLHIHFTWLFFRFHCAYLYFFERIAAKLLGNPRFALPFWSNLTQLYLFQSNITTSIV